MKVEVLYFRGCPNVERARALVKQCLAELGINIQVAECDGNYPSPTILVNGIDVMGEPLVHAHGCRLDLPTKEGVLDALRQAIATSGRDSLARC